MKKQYKGIARAVSLALVIFMMVPAVCGAAVINEKNPANGIGVNHLVDTGNFRYSRDCDESEYGIDDHTGRTEDGQRDIVLINTPFYKTFYASISTDSYLLDNGAKKIMTMGELEAAREENAEDYNIAYGIVGEDGQTRGEGADERVFVVENISVRANINIRMDQFLKEMDQGSVWKGLFTVEWNGISLADGITGYLQNVPGGEKKGYTVLHIPKEETKEEITMRMNFNLSGEDLIWEEAMEDQAEKELMEHADTKTAYIDSISKIIWDGQPLTWEEDSYCGEIEYNTSTGKVNFAVELFPYQKEIYADYNGNYTGDTMAGTYYTKLDNTVTGDEFEAEITGLTQEAGRTITFASKDSRYVVEMVTGEGPKTETKASSQWEHGTRDDFLYGLSRGETRAILPEQLPFTMAVAPDGGSVTISVTKAYDAWCSAIATYGDEEYGLYETANSDQYGFIYTFSLDNNGPVHNIQFTGLSIEPYAVQESYDLMFYVQDGQLFWRHCSQSVQTNEDYSGAQALELLKEFSIWR